MTSISFPPTNVTGYTHESFNRSDSVNLSEYLKNLGDKPIDVDELRQVLSKVDRLDPETMMALEQIEARLAKEGKSVEITITPWNDTSIANEIREMVQKGVPASEIDKRMREYVDNNEFLNDRYPKVSISVKVTPNAGVGLLSRPDWPLIATRMTPSSVNVQPMSASVVSLDQPQLMSASSAGITTGKLQSMSKDDIVIDTFAVMALFHEMLVRGRSAVAQERSAALDMQVRALDNVTQKMRDAAVKRLLGTIVSGGAQILGGVLQGTLAVAGGLAKTENVAKMFLTSAGAAADIVKGLGSIGSGGLEFSAAQDDADKSQQEKAATVARTTYDRANDRAQQLNTDRSSIAQMLSSLENADADTRKQTVRV